MLQINVLSHGTKANSVGSSSSKSPVGVAEKKLLLVFLYFFLLIVISYTGFSLFHRKVERYSSELQIYFNCEQYGHDPNDPCDRTGFEQLAFPAATAVSFILIELSLLINFVFVINIQLGLEIKSQINVCQEEVKHHVLTTLLLHLCKY